MKIKKPEDDIQDDEILAPPSFLEGLFKTGDPLTVGDVYNYCQKYVPCSFKKKPSDLTKKELEEVSNEIRKFILAWYNIEGNHQIRWENAISICARRQPNERLH
jgi:hypothetical protein